MVYFPTFTKKTNVYTIHGCCGIRNSSTQFLDGHAFHHKFLQEVTGKFFNPLGLPDLPPFFPATTSIQCENRAVTKLSVKISVNCWLVQKRDLYCMAYDRSQTISLGRMLPSSRGINVDGPKILLKSSVDIANSPCT